jgi:ribosome biogenesis GTPase / thiamine phosphate phosphatase
MTAMPGGLLRGTVTKIHGGTSTVDAGPDGVYQCDLRARLHRKAKTRLAVGDRVALEPVTTDDGAEARGVIEEVEERRSSLRRSRDLKRDQIVCANVDRIFVVVAAMDPPYKRPFIDRLMVGIERDQLQPFLIVNKIDLSDDEYRELIAEDMDVYERLGYPSLLVSAGTGEGLDALKDAFRGHISAVIGPSGVGKSTLLNAVIPGLTLRTGEVSDVDGRGKHTTTSAELVRVPGTGDGTPGAGPPGFVIDTPGVRAFGLWDLEPQELLFGFKEIAAVVHECRFTNCGHRDEPGCAVKQAVEAGEIDHERFESFLKLRDEVDAEAAERQAGRRR